MKKKFALLLLSLLCLCACALGITACNSGGRNNNENAGFEYSWHYEHGERDGYEIYYNGKTTESVLIIPSEYEGEPVTGIRFSAFKDCTSLESATLTATLTSIGSSAFEGCTSLKSVTIPDSVTEIGRDAFKNCPIETATMPALACGYVSNPKLKTAVLTSGDSIDQSAFNGCAVLENLTLPATLTSIGGGAFSGCASLKELAFPEKDCVLTFIGGGAFEGCTSLETVTIPESVTEIGNGAFTGCKKLRAVHWNAENATAESEIFRDCCTAINDWNGMTLNIGSKVKKIPAAFSNANFFKLNFITGSVCEEISAGAFEYCNKLTLVNLPESLKTIGSKAFRGCKSLFKMNIPKNVETIDTDAFDGCEKLIEVYNGSQLTVEKESSANCSVAYYAKNVYNPKEGGTKIIYSGDYAFYNDNNSYYLIGSQSQNCNTYDDELSLNLPKGVMQYGVKIAEYYKLYKYAFAYRNDNSVYIPANVTEYGDYALSGLSKLKSIEVDDNSSILATQDGILYNKAKTEILIIPANISGDITIPNGITSIDWYAFEDRISLTSVTIPNSVSSIGEKAFSGCTSLTSVTIGNGVKSIGSSAFSGCTSLTSVTIPESVTSIGEEAFVCKSLENVYISNIATWCSVSMGYSAFAYPYNLYLNGETLTELITPDNITEIKAYVFVGCKSIAKINIPENIILIGDYAFYYCTSLNSITVDENNKNYKSINDCLLNKDGTELIRGTNDSIIPNGVSSISDVAFSGCLSVSQISLPDGIISIGERSFYGCSSLTSITIPDSVTSIGSNAFYNCRLLTSINFKGTTDEWKAIEKSFTWDGNSDKYTVYCTDGTVAKDGTVTKN